MRSQFDRLDALSRLGLANLIRVGLYRIGLKTRLHPVLNITASPAVPPFFRGESSARSSDLERQGRWLDTWRPFGGEALPLKGPPSWNRSPFEPAVALREDAEWNEIGDFSSGVSDIKAVWEASRFDWVVAMAQRAAQGDLAEAKRLNRWLDDWQKACPPYRGPNWKCGQEASIRVLHLAAAALVLEEDQEPLPGLIELVRMHCRRIAPTMSYAKGQDNNHGTSEAAALFIAGSWLSHCGDREGGGWQSTGLAALEERCMRLIETDGTFSQYSTTYHRLMLDTLSLAESWRRAFGLAPFSDPVYQRLGAATHWLHQLTNAQTGDAPNLGANDGAHIIALTNGGYRDFRPSVQWASALFCHARAYSEAGSYDQQLGWLGQALPDAVLPQRSSETFDKGGLHVLRNERSAAYLRFPRFRFRPSQSDLLHCDYWFEGENMLRDGGTYSYSASAQDAEFFAGTASHNTVQFDRRDQMPRVGRFLFSRWPEAEGVNPVVEEEGRVSAAAGYRDWRGASHHRTLVLDGDRLTCHDRLSGKADEAILRWRLAPGTWRIEGDKVRGERLDLRITAENGDIDLRLNESAESRFYLQKTPLPLVEVYCQLPATVVTEILPR